jgi:hypothetical protein
MSAVGIASPATSSGIPAATIEAKTPMRMMIVNGIASDSPRWRSFSCWAVESSVSGAYPLTRIE